jgi:hypothetical protein
MWFPGVLGDLCGENVLGFDHFAAAQAAGTDAEALVAALHFGSHRAQINVPAPPRGVVGVADSISKLRPLAADITNLCHDCSRWV